MLLNAAKCTGYSFYHLWVNKGKPTPPLPSPRLPHPNPDLWIFATVVIIGLDLIVFNTNWLTDKLGGLEDQ